MNPAGTSRVRALALVAFRIAFGLMFMQHGMQKRWGWFTDMDPFPITSQLGLAGILELWGGLLIVLGLFTRPVALVLALEMVVAYFQAHLPQGAVPVQNGGELAVLYAFAFLYLAAAGSGRFSLDGVLAARRGAAAETAPA